jgi:hypothetical protein
LARAGRPTAITPSRGGARRTGLDSIRRVAAPVALATLLVGCGTYVVPSTIEPAPFLTRVETQTEGSVSVSTTVLTTEESEAWFGTPLAPKGIQPIWLELRNDGPRKLVLNLLAVDADYFSPSEAAWRSRRNAGEGGMEEKQFYFNEQHVPLTVGAGTTASGFVYTNLDPALKVVTVELVGDGVQHVFEFLLPVPGFVADFELVDFDALYAESGIRDLDLEGLRAYVESLPCCALAADGETRGDPLNLVLVGDGPHLLSTLAKRGWDVTETVGEDTALASAGATVFGSEYRTSPISALYLFDRPQDVALQKARRSASQRARVRLWLAPVTLGGKRVWIGQIGRDVGLKASATTFVSHELDPMVDEARVYFLLDLLNAERVERAGHVRGVGRATLAAPHLNQGDDPYFTDGLRVVIVASDETHEFGRIDWLDWEQPSLTMEDLLEPVSP